MDTSLYTWQTPQGHLSLVAEGQAYGVFLDNGTTNIRIDKDNVRFEGPEITDLAHKVAEFFMSYFPVVTESASVYSVVFYEIAILDEEPEEVLKNFEYEGNALEKKVLLPFSSKAPTYRRVIPGLNLEGTCATPNCLANGKVVYIPIGMGKYQVPRLVDEKGSCPACKKPIPSDAIKNLGFWKCTYTIDGKKTAPVEEKVDRTETAIEQQFTTFESGDNATWKYLDITTQPTPQTVIQPAPASKPKSSGCILF